MLLNLRKNQKWDGLTTFFSSSPTSSLLPCLVDIQSTRILLGTSFILTPNSLVKLSSFRYLWICDHGGKYHRHDLFHPHSTFQIKPCLLYRRYILNAIWSDHDSFPLLPVISEANLFIRSNNIWVFKSSCLMPIFTVDAIF